MKKLLTLLAAAFFVNANAQICLTRLDSITVAQKSSSVCHGDFNADGKPALAVASINGNISVMLGAGSGTFGAITSFTVNSGGAGCSIITADFNSDGKADLATANFANQNVSVLLGDGAGNFATPTNFTLNVNVMPMQIISADFNGDGKSDLATTCPIYSGPSTDNISILTNNGAASFSLTDTITSGGGFPTDPYSLTAADFNGDGKMDIACANIYQNSVGVFLGTGTGTFGAVTNFAVGYMPCSITAADFNNDGKTDIATVNSGGTNDISLLIGNGVGSFAAATSFPIFSTPKQIISGDFNNDGNIDVVFTNPASLGIYEGNGAGSFINYHQIILGSQYGWSTRRPLTAADFNADGRLDIAVADSATSELIILLNTIVPTLSISATSTNVCSGGGNIILTASGSNSGYVWSTSATTNTIAVTPTITTTYSVSDGTACSDTATITLHVGAPIVPNICMVTTDSATNYSYNIVYWDKTPYNNVDSFIVYRKDVFSASYLRIGAVSKNALSEFTDTAFSIGGPNGGNPQYSSWSYKLAIRDTCGNISAMSPYHQTMFVQENNANFSWNAYVVETGQTNPLLGYSFLRDDNNTGAWHTLVNTVNISATDPNYSSYPNGNWRIDAVGFNCTPTMRLAGGGSLQSTYTRAHSNTSKPLVQGIKQAVANTQAPTIYPNPSNGYFVIQTIPAANQSMQLFNANGKLLLSQTINGNTVIDGSRLAEGVYYISITSNEGVVNKKLVIVK